MVVSTFLLYALAGLLAGLLCFFVFGGLSALSRRWDAWHGLRAREVVVNLKTGRAVSGFLVRRDSGLLFLKQAVLLEHGESPAQIDGEAVLLVAEVDFIQVL